MIKPLVFTVALGVAPTLAAAQTGTAGIQAQQTLATATIPQQVFANEQPLPPGTYELRLTSEWLEPMTAETQGLRWVEFLANGRVVAREAAVVIPADQIDQVSSWHPADGQSRVDLLRSGDFVRIWVNRGGTNYLVHLPTQQ